MPDWSKYTTKETATDGVPWYALSLFSVGQNDVADQLEQGEVCTFIPLHDVVFTDRQGHRRHELRPVVTNFLFVKLSTSSEQLEQLLEPFKGHYYIVRKERGSKEYYEIPASQMSEFITMCNPALAERKFLSEEEARLKPGAHVLVDHGPLKGLTGRLVRSSGRYYLLKEVPGMAVMLKVTRWCCKELP